MNVLIKKLFFLFFPILTLVALTNFLIDPTHLLSTKFYQSAAKHLSSGSNIIIVDDCNERTLLKEFIESKPPVSKHLILGSSRTLIIDEAIIGEPILNLSVTGADIEDLIATYSLYEKKIGQPEKVFIGIDPWMFNESRNSERFHSLLNYYNAIATLLGENEVMKKQQDFDFQTIVSFEYFQNSLKSIFKYGLHEVMPTPTKETEMPLAKVKSFNGSLKYPTTWNTKKNEIEIAANRYIREPHLYGSANFNSISSKRTMLLEKFLQYLLSKKCDIVLFMSPYHPIVWNFIDNNQKCKPIKDTERKVIQISEKHSIKCIGSYNPKKLNLISTDFYDGMHINYIGLTEIIN